MYDQTYANNNDDDQTGNPLEVPDVLRVHYPNLALALGGRAGSKKEKKAPIEPASLILFLRDGGLGFVICPKNAPKNAHGFLSEPELIMDEIEAEIANGRIGWKYPSKRSR